jgi:hypothetical protein
MLGAGQQAHSVDAMQTPWTHLQNWGGGIACGSEEIMPPQSQSLQHWPQSPVVGQQNSPTPEQSLKPNTQRFCKHCAVVQRSVSTHSSALTHWMQPSWGSQRRPPAVSEQLLLFGVWRQEPFSQVSSVQGTPSLQSVFWQQVRQPTPGQQRKLPLQPL